MHLHFCVSAVYLWMLALLIAVTTDCRATSKASAGHMGHVSVDLREHVIMFDHRECHVNNDVVPK
eukprot:1408104-Amphidinium_carterae.1